MTIRTPHRRISPRTKRRYRAIKNFFRKALGTPSQADIRDTSNISVRVSDLQNTIIGLQEQLHKVSKHCRDFSCLEQNIRKKSLNQLFSQCLRDESVGHPVTSDGNVNHVETQLIYKSSDRQYHRTDESNTLNPQSQDDKNTMSSYNQGQGLKPIDMHKKRDTNDANTFVEHNRRNREKRKPPTSIYSTSSFHSLIEPKNKHYHRAGCLDTYKTKAIDPLTVKECKRDKNKRNLKLQDKAHGSQERDHKSKREHIHLDQDFITDIINKQYRPVKLFGRRDSDFSQFSAPLCRDQEFKVHDYIQEDCELCSCCFEGHKPRRRCLRDTDFSDAKSICDTRLYSSKRNRRYRYTGGCVEDYNNATYYDVVPVKEKPSPKTRRKIARDPITPYSYSKEVPPSPRTHKPRLNLKAQYHSGNLETYNYDSRYSRRNSPTPSHRREMRNVYETDVSSECCRLKRSKEYMRSPKLLKPQRIQEDVGTMSSLQYTNYANEQNTSYNDTTVNTQVTNSTSDKTDKALSEIKDILQNFLLEIKKESAHVRTSDASQKVDESFNRPEDNHNMNTPDPNSGHSFNNCNTGQCAVPPFVPAYTNPCCYQMMPLCPVNCLQNGYVLPNPSFTCNVCSKNSKPTCSEKDFSNRHNKSEGVTSSSETQQLIKEIYKYVSQNTKSLRNTEHSNDRGNSKADCQKFEKKILTSRSVGGRSEASHHDANVGTPNLKCYSKSCEAIGCKMNSDSYNTTTASYSDTILEKLSLEESESSTESDESSDVPRRKSKKSKLRKVFQSLKLFKKKHKKDIIEEESETESKVEEEAKPRSPYRQHITNYAMHGQEFFHPPPIPQPHCCSPHLHEASHAERFGPTYNPYMHPSDIYNHQRHHLTIPPCYSQHPTQQHPKCDSHCNYAPQPQPQVPLCLKEVEVKSIGTQSFKRISFLEKLTAKAQPPPQTTPQPNTTPQREKPNFWKTLQEKAKQNNPDPMEFSLKTQKQLAQGDYKLRNAMLKKLFYKRNPFSPRNLIIKTILGKDKSSFGDPPKMYRPRMFL
ncbi:hypothetical protein KGM_205947 [Danaus plexippus plexippus]|uniref:Uncharacterized protein n=1 Tax=Danaus plexippus plexippus TaxID=278856 RepID=A0A212FNU0_DANPL|nr:uncharacterized protein LOC116767758 [Danaus plexippus plexippus]OWR55411.1 hypothetical protein KGM_205947 [Danaus plexippus plexippus]